MLVSAIASPRADKEGIIYIDGEKMNFLIFYITMKFLPLLLCTTLAAPMCAAVPLSSPIHSAQVDTSAVNAAVAFLYQYLPAPDAADYPKAYFTAQAEVAVRAREEMPWGATVPEREWRHFVLPPRVNNEALDAFRTVKYDELRARVAGLSMHDAVLEVNHWCHEHVTYRPSDARTSSPLATLRTATGRCGEESTLLVAALRTIGIPARQVYTPRWAHTDDNHAWVEAWVDGKWCFLGACEPEPVLNLGWFNAPASRGMLMHTKVFGQYDGPEDVIQRTPCFTEINVTENYARTARTVVEVVDKRGLPVKGANVAFKLYNYGELYTVFSTRTDSEGRASILTGLGDFVAWATLADGSYGFQKITAGKSAAPVRIAVDRLQGEVWTEELTLTPPRQTNNVPEVTPEQRAENTRRLAFEDSIRTAYVATFLSADRTQKLCTQLQLPYARVRRLVEKSEGNWQNLRDVLEKYPRLATLDFLETLTEKDLRDFDKSVVLAHLDELTWIFSQHLDLTPAQHSFLLQYVACPRISTEALSAWRAPLGEALKEKADEYMGHPDRLALAIARRTTDTAARNPQGLLQLPLSTWQLRAADHDARALLFVAACRTLGVAARVNEVTGATEYAISPAGASAENAEWIVADALLDAATPSKTAGKQKAAKQPAKQRPAHFALDFSPRPYMDNPHYYTHFTLSRLDATGATHLLNYAENATWQPDFATPQAIEEGQLLLTTGTRLADGTVLARLAMLKATAGDTLRAPLVMRQDASAVQVIGALNSETRYFSPADNTEKSILATTGRGYFVCGLIQTNHEPTNHILHDLARQRAALEKWGRPIVLLFATTDDYERFMARRAEFADLPATVTFGVDRNGALAAQLLSTSLAPTKELPVITIADTFNRVVFATQGYTIGIGDAIKGVVEKLE